MTNNTSCKHSENVTAYLQEEMEQNERDRFTEHLTNCTVCSKAFADYQRVLKELKEVPPEIPHSNIADKVLDKIQTRQKLGIRYIRWAATAAGILIIISALFIISRHGPDTQSTLAKGLEWIAQNQETTGKWSVEKWGGNRQYEVALSSLSIMALVGSNPGQREIYIKNIRKGVDYLLDQQVPEGRFGPLFNGALYNHGIATVCLLEVSALTKDERLERPIKSALNYIRQTQTPNGGWGYVTLPDEVPNTAASFWVLQALVWGKAMGFKDVAPALENGFQWLARISDEQGRPGYRTKNDFPYGAETLSAMAAFCYTYGGAKYLPEPEKYQCLLRNIPQQALPIKDMNYYHLYFISYLEYPEISKWHEDMNKMLVRNQSNTNTLCGSWEANDQWGQVGGRIYSTALATLTLEANNRRPWLRNCLK